MEDVGPWYASLHYLAKVKTGLPRDVMQGIPPRACTFGGLWHGGTCWRGAVGTLFCMTPTSLRTPVSPDDLTREWRCCVGVSPGGYEVRTETPLVVCTWYRSTGARKRQDERGCVPASEDPTRRAAARRT